MKKLKTFDLSYFIGKNIFGDDGFQNMFAYQVKFNTIELKKDNDTNYLISWKSKGVYNCKLTPVNTAFLHKVKISWYKMGIQFNKSILVVEQNKYKTKVANAYAVYDLDDWSKIPLINSTLRNC